MRKFILSAVGLALAASVSAHAERIILDLKDYDTDLMKDLERTIKYFEPDIAGQNNDGVADDAKILAEGFRYTEQYFAKKGSYPNAVQWSLEGQVRIAAVLKAVAAGDYDAAVVEARVAVQQCKNCHDVYKPVTAR
jgi:hypothetical protein